MMNILLLGSGGREHALAWKLAQSPRIGNLFIAPGNAGTGMIGKNLPVSATDFPAIADAAIRHQIDMVVVGPEDPLVKGIRNYFEIRPELQGIRIVGPGADGAQLEGSKDFAKQFMNRHGIPTAKHATFTPGQLDEGAAFLRSLTPPYVLKADGLAAGKGVVICQTFEEASAELQSMLRDKKFGAASEKVVIEEFLRGIELSVFFITDGKSFLLLPEAKDYKRIGEGDTGPNTGGMGSVSPVPFAGTEFMTRVRERIIVPTMNGLISEGIDYRGFVFVGLMIVGGDPFVIEYNCRLGDPETESVIPRIQNDLLPVLDSLSNQTLSRHEIVFNPDFATTVMLVSKGYPDQYQKGKVISEYKNIDDSLLFHAGTLPGNKDGEAVTNGGRVMAITSRGKSIREALDICYKNAERISFEGKEFRRDIGFDL
jgi:phosphoribosylamine--glycine ligase